MLYTFAILVHYRNQEIDMIKDELGIPIKSVTSLAGFVYPISGEMLTMVQKRHYSFGMTGRNTNGVTLSQPVVNTVYCEVTLDEDHFFVEVYALPSGKVTKNKQHFTIREQVYLTEDQIEELSLRIARALESEGL